MRFLIFSLVLVFGSFIATVQAAGLPDTGQDTCYNDTAADSVAAANAASIASDGGSHPRQDCRYGRDAAAAVGVLTKIGAGAKNFDYTKIANDGSTLAAAAVLGTAATDWACTKDNITGLTWEVKTATNTDLRYSGHTYTWYNSNGATNAGNAGTVSGGTCKTAGRCDTEKFVADVNAAALCTYTDWRMPTLRELITLVYADGASPSIDPTYFPNTPATEFWSSSTCVGCGTTDAWHVTFNDGSANGFFKGSIYNVRLVRGGQF